MRSFKFIKSVLLFTFLALGLLLGKALLVGDAHAMPADSSAQSDAAGRVNTSQQTASNPYVPVETCPPGTPTRIPTPLFTPAPDCSDVPPTGVLTATISDHFGTTDALFTNASATCSYRIG